MIRHIKTPMSRKKMWTRIAIVVVLGVLLVVGFIYGRMEGQNPRIAFDREFEALRRGGGPRTHS